jgi:hypothetical protein
MSSEESNKTLRQTPSQDSPSNEEAYRSILDAAEHGWDELLDRADQPANPFAEELWLMEKKKAMQQQQQQGDDIVVNMDGGVGGSWQTAEPQKERNTRHSVDKGEEFIRSGMTLITDLESDKYLKSARQDSE